MYKNIILTVNIDTSKHKYIKVHLLNENYEYFIPIHTYTNTLTNTYTYTDTKNNNIYNILWYGGGGGTEVIKEVNILWNFSLLLTVKVITRIDMASNRKEDEIPSTYNCLQCSSKFKHKFNLTKHIKSVHTQDEFQCDQCASSFGRKDSLEKHKRRKHTIKKCEECEFNHVIIINWQIMWWGFILWMIILRKVHSIESWWI